MDPINSIVVPTDFSDLSAAAIERAIDLARLNGASIHLLHALRFPALTTPYEVSVPAAVIQGLREGAEGQLAKAREAIVEKGITNVTVEIDEAEDTDGAIADAVRTHGADLVVMGSHGHSGLKRAFLGSVAERTLRSSPCPVMVVKEDAKKADEPISRILIPVDFSPHAKKAVDVATALARRVGASIDVLHVIDTPPDFVPYASLFGVELEQKMQKSAAEELAPIAKSIEEVNVPVSLHTVRGQPSIAVSKAAEKFGSDLIVMGTRGASGLAHVLLGSVAERTIRTSRCSVLAVRADEEGEAGE
ncbi:MAG: universal stress protein [Myxococcota bacterium]|jgi:nucleotide-binding universal stress UspA family protein|nr:universal stress protein [Myxococcota bacterium]